MRRPVSSGALAILLLCAASAWAAVDGTVINQTTGKAQPGATVSMFKFGQAGPEMIDSVKSDAAGKFRFEKDLEPGAPANIQTTFDGVTYNHMITPGQPITDLRLDVYNASKKAGAAQVAQHLMLFEPSGQQLGVQETFFYKNDGKLSYHDPDNGTLRFFVPEAGKESLKVRATAPQGMPIERPADAAGAAGVYKLDFPIKPGETRIDVTYTMPFTSPGTFSGKMFYKSSDTKIAVPAGVTLQGDGVTSLGKEPQSQAPIYEVKGESFTFRIEGSGTMQQPQAASAAGGTDDDSGPQVQAILPPQFADRRVAIFVLALTVLALGFILVYKKGQAQSAAHK